MISVDLDSQIFVLQRRGGISSYFVHLAREFADPGLGIDLGLPFWISYNDHLREAAIAPLWQPPVERRFHQAALLVNRLLPRRRKRGDLLHTTYYHPWGLSSAQGRPVVVTIHDMIPELFPQFFPSGNPHLAKADYVKRADAVICISDSTKHDLISLWGVELKRISVIHPGMTFAECAPIGAAISNVPHEYVLFVGQRNGYKNFDTLAKAMSLLVRRQTAVRLLCVGGDKFSEHESRRLRELGIAARVTWTQASDAQLRSLYRGASAFVFPSLYEGFGLPLLEAMAQHCPVVASRGSSFGEVCDTAAEYFDPHNAEEIAAALDRVLSDHARRRELTRLGDLRCRDFTWRRTAERTTEVYHSLVRQRGGNCVSEAR